MLPLQTKCQLTTFIVTKTVKAEFQSESQNSSWTDMDWYVSQQQTGWGLRWGGMRWQAMLQGATLLHCHTATLLHYYTFTLLHWCHHIYCPSE